MEYYKKKLDKLIEHSVKTFQSNNNVHINARKSAEALCKLIIFKYYGATRGTAIIYQQDNEWNSRLKVTKIQQRQSYPMVLNMLIQVCTSKAVLRSCYRKEYKDRELSNVIKNTIIYLESNLYALNSRGNRDAHESYRQALYAETTQNLLREVLEWLFQDFLKIEIPIELVAYIGTYDIFISYQQEDETWIEVLKKNLLAYDYKLFIDNYQLIAGKNTKKSLRHAIKNSRNAIIIYPNNDASLWIKNELEWIKEKQEQDNSFKSIPIVIHNGQNHPPKNITYIDFNKQSYAEAFNQILCSLKNVPPSQNYLQHELELPNTPEIFVNEIMKKLETEKVVKLFSQEFSETRKYLIPIKVQLEKKFTKHFYELSIPDYKKKKYFNFLSESCGIEESIEELQGWKRAMQKKLSSGEEVLLYISDFQNGKEKCNIALASSLRTLSDDFNNFYVVLVGDKALAKLVFQENNLSPLKSIGIHEFFPYDNSLIAYEKLLPVLSHPLIEEHKEHLFKLLAKDKIKRFIPWSYDEFINYLFWKGIFIKKKGYLVWRNEELKANIKEILNKSDNEL